jgi:bifunctional DNA-binding transcriptional regulator/antitoxin component of YhaV-PrlF toxin-antitoxin module
MKASGFRTQKLQGTNGSLFITLPSDWAKALHLKKGDRVQVIYGDVLIVKPLKLYEVEREISKWLKHEGVKKK